MFTSSGRRSHLAKLVVGGLAAVLSVALAAVVLAQGVQPSATMTASVSPSTAGTKSQPTPARVKLFVQDHKAANTTMSKLVVSLPKNAKVSGKGFESCSASKFEKTPSKCTITSAGGDYGSKMTIAIPQDLQQSAPATYLALVDPRANLDKKSGKNSLITTTGCPSGKEHQFKAQLSYAPNPNPPAAPSAEATNSAKCS